MACKRGERTQVRLVVKVTYISVPSAETRLAQAIDLLLKSAAINNTTALEDADSKVKNLSAHDTEGNLGKLKDKG